MKLINKGVSPLDRLVFFIKQNIWRYKKHKLKLKKEQQKRLKSYYR